MLLVPGSTRSYLQGDQRLTVMAFGTRGPGARLDFPTAHEALRFVRSLGGVAVARELLGLLPTAPALAVDEARALAAVAHALVGGALRVYRETLPLLTGPGNGGGGNTGPVNPPRPPANDDAKLEVSCEPPAVWQLRARIPTADELGHAFEQSTLIVQAELVSGVETRTRGRLEVVKRDGTLLAARDFDPRAGTLSWDHPTATLDDDEGPRRVRAVLKVDDEVQQGHEDFTLWPRSILLRARHRDTAALLTGFAFEVIQARFVARAKTADTGEVRVDLPRPGPFEVFADAPSEITSWTDAIGRVREARGVTAFKAVIDAPARPASGGVIKQYVNLVSTTAGHDARGHALQVRVRGEAPAQQGDLVFVRVRFGRQSRRNDPLPAVTGLTAMVVEADSFLVTGHVVLDANRAAQFDIELGLAGGDTCDIAIGGTRAARDDTRSLENWRKLFYQVTRPAAMPTPSLALMTAGLAKVFVEYEKYKEVTFDEADAGTPAGSWFDGAHFGLAGRCVNVGDHNKAFFHAKFDDQHNPVGVHVLFCHAQFDGGAPAHQTTWQAIVGPSTPTVNFPGGGNVSGVRTKIAGHVFPKAFQDGNDSVRDVTWESLAPSGPWATATGSIGAGDIHVDWVNDRNFVTIRLPAAALAVIAAGHPVRVTATALWSRGVYLGEADGTHGNWQLIRNNANDAATQTNAVMTHELGHTMSMVLDTVPPGTDAGAHGYRYEARGHQGSHCAFGVNDAVFASGQSLKGAGGTCVMFGAAGAASPSNFCPRCAPFVRAQNLTTIA